MPAGMRTIAAGSSLQHGLPSCNRSLPTARPVARYHRSNISTGAMRPIMSTSSEVEGDKTSAEERSNISQTLADLDALLGIEEKPEETPETKVDLPPGIENYQETNIQMSVGVSPEVFKAIAEAELERAKNAGLPAANETNKTVEDKITRLVEQARKFNEAEAKNEDNTAGESAMRREFESLLTALTQDRGVDEADVKIMKDKVFGAQTFWMSETVPIPGLGGGIIVRGNFRGQQETVFAEVCRRVADLFGDKYVVRLTEEIDFESGDIMSPPEPRVVFLIVPKETAEPKPAVGWQRGAAAVLLALTLASSLQLGLAASVGLLPKETLLWLANPANLSGAEAGIMPPGLDTFDPVPFVQSAITVGGVALLPQLSHELGHAIAAGIKGIKTGPSFLIPNGQIGTFGSVTQLKSLVKDRTDLFDFAASGLVAGGVASVALFIAGLVASHGGNADTAGLVPVPSILFQGSLLLGSLAKFSLGADAMARTNVYVSPLLIGGWCGLVSFALNSLPVGNLDGGRTMLAAFGKEVLGFTSLLSYLGLGLGLLGSSLSLPFGLYVLICQRESESNVQNEISEVDSQRQGVAVAIALLALAVLLPGIPDPTELALLGEPGSFL